ncbi:FHA domain-containing protein [Schumannella sp. 10F1B-5-1]|uniref:FHA domain-containing protein n=1 Tax=Schumannella sp. 10F1B-5-1 TaxID=2590780 RepID=UPI0015E84412|nr:FHA domain-containing protein [Schumannella sp. 10F1B-5-1]
MQLDDDDTRPRAAVPLAGPPAAVDDLEETLRLGATTQHRLLREPTPRRAPPARPPVAPAHLTHRVRVGGAAPLSLGAPVLVGRAPRAPRIPAGLPAQLVVVASLTGEISSTHVELTEVGHAVVVRDLRSTNGTRVVTPGGPARMLAPGESAVVAAGTVIELGDGVAVEVLPPGVAGATGSGGDGGAGTR